MTLLMAVGAWDTINTLAFNRKVLLVGVDDGDEALSLAQVARVVAVCAMTGSGESGAELHVVQHISEAAGNHGLRPQLLIHTQPWPEVIATYGAGQFDLAVVNPAAARMDEIGPVLEHLMILATRLVVIQPDETDLWEAVTEAAARRGLVCSSDRSIIVAAPPLAENTVGGA